MKKKLADEAEMERQRQQPLKEQDECWRLHMEQPQAEHQSTQPAIQGDETDQAGHSCGFRKATAEPGNDNCRHTTIGIVACSPCTAPHILSATKRSFVQELPRRPLAAPTEPWGQEAEWQAANSLSGARACNNEVKDLVATADAVLGHAQQPSQQTAEPPQDACGLAEGGAQAALSVDKAHKCLTPDAAEQGLLVRLAPLSLLPQPAQEAPASTSGLQDMMDLPLPPVLRTTDHSVSSQWLSQPRYASGAVRTGSASAGAGQSGRERQLGELPAHSSHSQVAEAQARQAESFTGPPSSCMPAAVPGDELCPEDECSVWFAARRCVLLAPCGHIPYCVECAEQLCGPKGTYAIEKGQVCPLCQEAVLATVYKTFC